MHNIDTVPKETLIETFASLKQVLHPCDRLASLCEEIVKALTENRMADAKYFISEAKPDLIEIQDAISKWDKANKHETN